MFYDIDICNIASYADDNTSCTSDFNLEEVIQKLELITNNLFEWFKNNHIKTNADVVAKIGEPDLKIPGKKNFLMSKQIPSYLSKIMCLYFAKRQAKSYMHPQKL